MNEGSASAAVVPHGVRLLFRWAYQVRIFNLHAVQMCEEKINTLNYENTHTFHKYHDFDA